MVTAFANALGAIACGGAALSVVVVLATAGRPTPAVQEWQCARAVEARAYCDAWERAR